MKKVLYYIAIGSLYTLVLILILAMSFVLNSYVNKDRTIYAPQKIKYDQTEKATPKI